MSISGKVDPVVRSISVADVAEALSAGLRDFQAVPLYGLAFGALYAAGGNAILLCLTAFGLVYLAYPLAAGFALIGPFVAIGLYEMSRRREARQPISLGAIWNTVRSRSEIGWMAFVTLFLFVIWMYQVRLLIALLLGLNASFSSLQQFITVVLTTNEGLVFLAIGNAVGAALSLILFSLTVVSFPLLLDREVDFVTAMITSVRAVVTSPLPMIGWAAVIVVLLAVSALALFPRPVGDAAGARPRHLAPLSPHRRAGGGLGRDDEFVETYGIAIPSSFSAASIRAGGCIGMTIASPVSSRLLRLERIAGQPARLPDRISSLMGRSCDCNSVSFVTSPAGSIS
jgi:uncharacterized membrane protein